MKLPIIVLHGWGSSSAAWEVTKQLLQKAGYRVFIPDLPGFGKEPPPEKPWAVDHYVDFVLKFAKLAKFDKFVLIGHSFGGRIAIKLAAQYPGKVEKLILTGAAGIRFTTLREKIKVETFAFIAKLGGLAFYVFPFTFFKPLAKKFLYWWSGAKDYYHMENHALKETFKKVIYEDLTPYLEEIKIPTLLIWGEKDFMIPLPYAYLMHRKIKNSKLEIIKEANHVIPYAQPEIFVKKVTEFLGNI